MCSVDGSFQPSHTAVQHCSQDHHGYISGEHAKCEICNADTEIYSRVVGYLRPVSQWNNGKQTEFKMRKTYTAQKMVEKIAS